MTPRHDDDRELTSALESVTEAWRDTGQPGPPAELDTAVLRRAREAAHTRRRAWPWTRGWVHNLVTATVVVIAVALLLQLRQETPVPPEADTYAAPQADADGRMKTEARENFEAQDSIGITGARLREAPEAAAAEPAPAEAAVAEEEAMIDELAVPEDPERWLERILDLKREGDMEAFVTELAAFREAWPDYPLPDELADTEAPGE